MRLKLKSLLSVLIVFSISSCCSMLKGDRPQHEFKVLFDDTQNVYVVPIEDFNLLFETYVEHWDLKVEPLSIE